MSGGYIYNALAAGNRDAVEDEIETLDVCLCHPTPFSQFHYHFWSSCAVEGYGYASKTDAPPLCRDTDGCTTEPAKMTMNNSRNNQVPYFTAENWDKPVGLAKDGHLIMGPYKQDGSVYGCGDRDACNGAFVDG